MLVAVDISRAEMYVDIVSFTVKTVQWLKLLPLSCNRQMNYDTFILTSQQFLSYHQMNAS